MSVTFWVSFYALLIAPLVVTPWLASQKGRNPAWWGVLGIVFSWLALVVVALLPVVKDESARAASPKTLAGWLIAGALFTGLLAWGTERKEDALLAFDPRASSEAEAATRAHDAVVRLRRDDGMTFGTFVKMRMRRLCPELRASKIVFSPFMSTSGPDGVLWVVSVDYADRKPAHCLVSGAFEYQNAPIAGIRSSDGVVRAMADQHNETHGRYPTWLDHFRDGRAP